MSIAAAAAGAHGSWAGRGRGAQTGGRESGRAAAIGRRGLGGARVLAADGKRERDETPTRRGRVCGWTKGREGKVFVVLLREEGGGGRFYE